MYVVCLLILGKFSVCLSDSDVGMQEEKLEGSVEGDIMGMK